jgi:hypothetical protein
VFADLWKFEVTIKIGFLHCKSVNCHIFGGSPRNNAVPKYKKFCKSANLRLADLIAKYCTAEHLENFVKMFT